MARRGLVLTWLLTLSTLTSAQPGAVHAPGLSPGGSATAAVAPAVAPVAAAAATTAGLTSGPGLPAAKTVVEQAGTLMQELQRHVVQLVAQRVEINQRYRTELDTIDRLKRQRPSLWRDRELRDSLSSSLDTANQLSAVDRETKQVNLKLLSVRRAYLDAIDAELAGGPEPARVQQLLIERAPLARQFAVPARRFLMPDLEIDPLADPEEIDQRVIELRASEAELDRLLGLIDHELERVVRKDRAGDEVGEDVQREVAPPGHTASLGALLDGFAPTVLASGFAARTAAPAVAHDSEPASGTAEAVRRARNAVAERLEQVRRTRVDLEARSRMLRTPR